MPTTEPDVVPALLAAAEVLPAHFSDGDALRVEPLDAIQATTMSLPGGALAVESVLDGPGDLGALVLVITGLVDHRNGEIFSRDEARTLWTAALTESLDALRSGVGEFATGQAHLTDAFDALDAADEAAVVGVFAQDTLACLLLALPAETTGAGAAAELAAAVAAATAEAQGQGDEAEAPDGEGEAGADDAAGVAGGQTGHASGMSSDPPSGSAPPGVPSGMAPPEVAAPGSAAAAPPEAPWGASPPGPSYPGVPYPGAPDAGQSYPGQSHVGPPYPVAPHAGAPYPDPASWGAADPSGYGAGPYRTVDDQGRAAAMAAAQAAAEPLGPGFRPLSGGPVYAADPRRIELLRDVIMGVSVELGRTRLTVQEILGLTPGSIVELDRAAGAPVDVLVNGTLIAHGEVVVVDEEFAVRIVDVIRPGGDGRAGA